MHVPVAPISSKLVNEKGMLTDAWLQYFSSIESQLKFHLPDDGAIQSTVTNSQVSSMQNEFLDAENTVPNPKYKQTKLVYNKDTNAYMVNVNGVFKTINVT
jgi:hypothetical protein